MVRTDEEPIEALLRAHFGGTRDDVGELGNLHAVGEAGFARAARLRRRRTVVASGAAAAAVAAAVLAVTVGLGDLGRDSTVTPATRQSTTTAKWSAFIGAGGTFAYRFPDVLPEPLPDGMELASAPVATADADLSGFAGFCRWEDQPDHRQPVAGRAWQLSLTSPTGTYAAHLGLAGFATGSGHEAMLDIRGGVLPCTTGSDALPVRWNGPGEEAMTFTHTVAAADQQTTAVLAVTRVGDVLVSGTSRSRQPEQAREAATSLAAAAAERLLRDGFPPALGAELGASATPPNDASAVGAKPGAPLYPVAEYSIGDVWPEAKDLRYGMAYHGEALESAGVPAATGAQRCDFSGEPDEAHRKAQPDPVAGSQQEAWAGNGSDTAPAVTFTVSGWRTGTGAARFADLQADRGACGWSSPQVRETWPGQDPTGTWLSHGSGARRTTYLASRRVGDLIVSVVVSDLPADQARAEAVRLNGIVAAKVAASGLSAARGR